MNLADYRKLSNQIKGLYEELQQEFSGFQSKSTLHCLDQCGHCCSQSEVCASPYEMLPLAMDLIDRKLAESTIEKMANQPQSICISFQSLSENNHLGKCTEYPSRPIVCRTFGVAQYTTKRGPQLSLCKLIRDKYHPSNQFEEALVASAPSIHRAGQRFRALVPHNDELCREMPINDAIKTMIMTLMQSEYYESLQTTSN